MPVDFMARNWNLTKIKRYKNSIKKFVIKFLSYTENFCKSNFKGRKKKKRNKNLTTVLLNFLWRDKFIVRKVVAVGIWK